MNPCIYDGESTTLYSEEPAHLLEPCAEEFQTLSPLGMEDLGLAMVPHQEALQENPPQNPIGVTGGVFGLTGGITNSAKRFQEFTTKENVSPNQDSSLLHEHDFILNQLEQQPYG